MDSEQVSDALYTINDNLVEIKEQLATRKPETDKAFEIFKTFAPKLWENYNDLPTSEFDDVLDDVVLFSRKAARSFRIHALRAKQFQAAIEKQYPEESEVD